MGRIEELLIGRRVAGRYRVDAMLGRGGMGVVYRAGDERLGRDVALKVLSPPVDSQVHAEHLRARFRREAQSAASIRHRSVVTIFDYGTDPELDLDFLVMELLSGEDLAGLLARTGQLPLDQTLVILEEAAAGLAAGHRLGIVHRDVKPANIFLVEEDGSGPGVRLLDFGIAQGRPRPETLTRLTEFGRVPMTPLYASPEQIDGAGELSAASDIYSLGMTALAMLSAEPPRNRMLDGEPSPVRLDGLRLGALAPGLEKVLSRALHPDPRARFSSGEAFAEALHRLRGSKRNSAVSPAPSQARQAPLPAPPPGQRLRARSRRRRAAQGSFRTPVGAILAMIVLVGAGAAGVYLNKRSDAYEGDVAGSKLTSSAAPEADPAPPPVRPWPSLTEEEERLVRARQQEGTSELEAILRLAVEGETSCEFGGDRGACGRVKEIEAYLAKRSLVQIPPAEERERLATEILRIYEEIQDLRPSMQIVHPRLYAASGDPLDRLAARVFVRGTGVRKVVADLRLQMPGAPVRVVEEFYFERDGQLLLARRRTWGEAPEPLQEDRYFYQQGSLVQAQSSVHSAQSASALHLDALLVHDRGVAIKRGVEEGRSDILVSLGDLYPSFE